MPKTETKTETKKGWDAQAEINRFAPLEEAIEAQSDDWMALNEKQQTNLLDDLANLKDETQEDAYRKSDASHLKTQLKRYGVSHLMVQRMRSSDPNRQHYDNAVEAAAKHFIATGEGSALFNPIRKTKDGPTVLTMTALVEFVAGKYSADYDKNTDYSPAVDATEEDTQEE